MFNCSECDKYLVGEAKRLICSGCKFEYYCSKECQKNHWKEHKSVCASLVERFKGDSLATVHKDGHRVSLSLIYPDADSSKIDEAVDLAYKSEKKNDKARMYYEHCLEEFGEHHEKTTNAKTALSYAQAEIAITDQKINAIFQDHCPQNLSS